MVHDSLRIMAWNIQGVNSDVLDDSIFNYYLDNNDIIILSETWLSTKCDMRRNDFYCYHNLRPQAPKAWRPSGGISILIRNDLRSNKGKGKGITFLKENEYCIWMKICREYFELEADIYICGVYIPPVNSTFFNNPSHNNPFAELEKDISDLVTKGNLILWVISMHGLVRSPTTVTLKLSQK